MTVRRVDAQTEEQWLAARRSGIGSSDAPAILEVSPYAGPLEVYLDKIGGAVPRESTVAMRRGKALEPLAAALYAEQYPQRKVSDPEGGLFTYREWPVLVATPDRWVEDPERGPGLLELKSVGHWARGDWEIEPPLHVLVQVQHQLLCLGTDFRWAAVGALLGDTFVAYDVERNQNFIDSWITRARTFWGAVERREPPAATHASLDTLKVLYPTVRERVTVELPAESLSWDRALAEAEVEVKRWTAVRDEKKALFLQALGEAEAGVLPDGTARFVRSVVERKEYHVAAGSYVALKRKAVKP